MQKLAAQYVDTRPLPIAKPCGGENMHVRIKQDRGLALSDRTRGNSQPQRTHSNSVTAGSILGISRGPTARSMDAVKGADLQDEHPWKLLALCGSKDRALNVAAIHAMKALGRDKMCASLSGGYAELIERIVGELTDPSLEIRAAMADALGALAISADQDVIEALILASEDESDDVRVSAISSLALIAPREHTLDRCTSPAVQAVLARTTDDDPDVREAAVCALGALAPVGDKLAVETVIRALEDSHYMVQKAAMDGLILLGDVYELEDGENQLLEISVTSVHTKMPGEWIISVAVEPEIVLCDGGGPAQALQCWIALFGIQDFEARLQGCVEDGRSKLLALVEDGLNVIEGDIEVDARLVFWWPAGSRRVLFQTSDNWAWEYRKQCRYGEGYSYVDADTGQELFGSDFTFEKYFFIEADKEGLWHTLYLRGSQGGLRKELAKFQKPLAFHLPLEPSPHDGGETFRHACHGNFQIDTDVVQGCKALLVLNLTQQLKSAAIDTGRLAVKTTSDRSLFPPPPPAPTTYGRCPPSRGPKTFDTPAARRKQENAQVPRVLSTMIALAKTESEPLQISRALTTEEDQTWFAATHTLIEAQECLGARNQHSQAQSEADEASVPPKRRCPDPLPLTRTKIFSGESIFSAQGKLSLKTRHSNVEQRIVGGILRLLESSQLQIRKAALDAIQNFIGFGNQDAVAGVIRRLEHHQPDVRATAVVALRLVAEEGHVDALKACLERMQSSEWFVRASALEAFCGVCQSEDPRLMTALDSLMDDPDPRVRTVADELLVQYKESKKLRDQDVAKAAARILDENHFYHNWHAPIRECVQRQQGLKRGDGEETLDSQNQA